MKENRYPHVFQPLTVRGLTLKNRLQYAPTVVLKCTPDGQVGQEMLDFMKWQASTGVAYITVGDTPVTHDDNSAWLCEMNVNSDDCIHGMHALVEAARDNGAELSVELAYAGRGNRPNADGSPTAVVSAERPVSPELDNLRTMDRADMDYLRDRFVDCAVRCQKAGFRMIMLHCAHNNFLAQWLSPDSNVRTDEYGGSWENRCRFPLEVIRAVRAAVGPDYPISMRICGSDFIPGSNTNEEWAAFAPLAQEAGVDLLNVTVGWHESRVPQITGEVPWGGLTYTGKAIRDAVSIPVAIGGRINRPATAEQVLALGYGDLVTLGRALITDPDWPRKALEELMLTPKWDLT